MVVDAAVQRTAQQQAETLDDEKHYRGMWDFFWKYTSRYVVFLQFEGFLAGLIHSPYPRLKS
jgi:hypothetical protein